MGISIGPATPDIGTVGYVGGSAGALSAAIATNGYMMQQAPYCMIALEHYDVATLQLDLVLDRLPL